MVERSESSLDRGRELLQRWQEAGDVEALDELLQMEIRELRAKIRSQGKGLAPSPASVSDVVNDAVVRILQAEELPRFDDLRVFSAYLWRAAHRLLLDRVQRRASPVVADLTTREIEARLAVSGGLRAVEHADERQQVLLVMALLPAELRRILEKKYLQQMDTAAIALELGLTVDAARMRLVRAKQRLTEKLKGWRDLIG